MALTSNHEELWSAPTGVKSYMIVIQTCSVASRYSEKMVLAAAGKSGAAQAAQLYNNLPKMIYKKIREVYPKMPLDGTQDYGFLPVIDPPHGIGIFQTKRHWGSVSRIDTMQRSIEMLCEYAVQHPQVHIRMGFPASGEKRWGRKESPKRGEVEGLLCGLPDNIHIVNKGLY